MVRGALDKPEAKNGARMRAGDDPAATNLSMAARMSEAWRCEPVLRATVGKKSSLAASLWAHDVDDVQEAIAAVDSETHVISVQQTPHFIDLHKDERRVFKGEIAADTTCILEAGTRLQAVRCGRWSALHFYVPRVWLDTLAADHMDASSRPVVLVAGDCIHDPLFARVARDVIFEMREGLPLSRLRLDVLAQELGIQLVRAHSNRKDEPRTRAASRPPMQVSDWRVRRTIEQLEAHLGEDLSLAELAAGVDLSSSHYVRLFRAATGLAPHHWAMRRRIERACELLVDPSQTITDIALALGFSSSQHFATVFRKHMRVTPSAFRRDALVKFPAELSD